MSSMTVNLYVRRENSAPCQKVRPGFISITVLEQIHHRLFLSTLSGSQEWHFKGHVYPPAISLFHHHVLSSHKMSPDNEAGNPAGEIDVLFLLPPSGGYGSGAVRCEQSTFQGKCFEIEIITI